MIHKKIVVKLKTQATSYHLLETCLHSHLNFDEIADIILNRTLLHAQTHTYRICEIEFYYQSQEHNDTYTHGSPEQHMNYKFYFHKYHTGTYKAGTYKCLDMTLSPSEDVAFGVLIRSIQDQETLEVIEGPCRSLTRLLGQFGYDEVQPFLNDKVVPLSLFDSMYGLYLCDTTQLPSEKIYQGPRIGLSDKNPTFRERPYRYLIFLDQIKKQRKTMKEVTFP